MTSSQHQHQQGNGSQIPIDESFVDYGSESDDDGDATERTLASSAEAYRFENGRRYHAYREGSYWGPNDEKDSYHQSIMHHLVYLLQDDKLFLAPVERPRNVIDLGTGVGLWAIDFSEQYPDANVIGTDLSPIWEQPLQPNLRFEVDDCCSEWTYPAETKQRFDLVHMRGLFGSIDDWPTLYRNCIDHLVPGGWIEQVEFSLIPQSEDGSLETEGAEVYKWWHEFAWESSVRIGKPLFVAETMKQSIIDAGFVDVVERRSKLPIGAWSKDPKMKEVGKWYRDYWEYGMEGWIMALGTRVMGWSREKIHAVLNDTRRVIHDRTKHVYYEAIVVYGRKPESTAPAQGQPEAE